MSKKLWFRAKTYGWGWTVIVVFALLQVWNFLRIDTTSHSNSDTIRPFIIQLILSLIVLCFLCYTKGEKPGWRWGKKNN
jgi:hypothetical protein